MNSTNNENATSGGKKQVKRLVVILFVLAIVLLAVRYLNQQLYSSTDSVWSFQLNLSTSAKQHQTVIKFSPPVTTAHAQVIRQSLNHPSATVRFTKGKYDGKTILTFTPDRNGIIEIDAEFLIHITEHPRLQIATIPLDTLAKEKYLSDSPELDIYSQKLSDFSGELINKIETRKELADAIYRYVRTFTAQPSINESNPRGASELLGIKKISVIEQANLFIALSRAVKIPARLVTGFILRDQPEILPHHWVEIYLDGNWQAVELYHGYKYSLPSKYVPFRYGSSDVVSLVNGGDLEINYNLVETRYSYVDQANSDKNIISILSLNRLSQDLRNNLAALLLLPLGILITVIFRHFIGVHNYGVFAPSLLSLALTRNDFDITIMSIAIVIAIVGVGRTAFPKKMNRTPRLAIIFTLVILAMGIAVSFIDYYMPAPEDIVVLLPVVILSSLTDSFYKTLDTSGKHTALIRLFWTAVITMFCIPVLNWDALGHQLVMFPEIHLITLACILLITSLKGKQLVVLIPEFLREKPSTRTSRENPDSL